VSVPASLPVGVRPGGRFDGWAHRPAVYVVCDVDGTLVGPRHDAADEVVAAVARAQAAGIRVGVATGRMRDAVLPLIEQLGARGPHVLHNGAEVRDGDRLVASWSLTAEQVDGLLELGRTRDDTYVEVYTETGYVVSSMDERAQAHWEILGIQPRGVIGSASELDGVAVPKATLPAFDPASIPAIEAAVEELGLLAGGAGSPRTPGLFYINATHPEADKGRALARAAEHLGIGLDRTAAIGDEVNDLSMLAVAGSAIAMGQAAATIHEAAHLVVPEVDAHGVAVALDALVAWTAGPR
jgi:Cof subfamily protein (haloacid dehalogenase superfamily)